MNINAPPDAAAVAAIDVLTRLRDALGAAAVLIGAEVPERNRNDWSAQAPTTPLAVVRPLDAAGVSAALRACREAGLPVVPQGGLVEAQGTDDAIDGPRFAAWLEQLMEGGELADAAVAQSVGDTQAFWALRDACAEFFPTLGPHISYDVALAVRDMDAFATRCKAGLAAQIPRCQSVYYGHIGDGNIHLVAWVEGLSVEDQPKQRMDEVIYGLVRELEGSISAEHGIGTTKKPWLGHARSPQEIALMRTLKQALDPLNLLNPGKVI